MPHRMFGQFGPTMVVVRLPNDQYCYCGINHPPSAIYRFPVSKCYCRSSSDYSYVTAAALRSTSRLQFVPRPVSNYNGAVQWVRGKHVYISRWRVCGRCTTASKFDTTQCRPILACSRIRRNAMSIAGSTISVAGSTISVAGSTISVAGSTISVARSTISVAGSTESNRWD
jgi:hypothetical protein